MCYWGMTEETYLVSLVTAGRAPLLFAAPGLFYASWDGIRPIAWTLLPNHLHAVIQPSQFSLFDLMQQYMQRYSVAAGERIGCDAVWDDRIREQRLHDTEEFGAAIDFVHYDSVRHGLVDAAWKHGHSSFPLWVAKGVYDLEWRVK